MQRVTISIDNELANAIDKLARERGYKNRSETMRDLMRAAIHARPDGDPSRECVAGVVYVYQQVTRGLPERLANAYQDQHDLSVATLRVALDHETSIEMAVLRGETKEVERLADRIIAERGVRRGQVVVFPASIASERHSHGERRPRKHEHIKVC